MRSWDKLFFGAVGDGLLMEIPILGVGLMGEGSIGMFYVYFLGFDFIKFTIHSNVEVVPLWIFHMFPFLKYLLATLS
jgi:aldehyde decarbonylase